MILPYPANSCLSAGETPENRSCLTPSRLSKKEPRLCKTGFCLLGGAWGIRTPDLNIANVARYQLC